MEDMELKVQEVTLPDIIAFNYEELKAELQSRCEFYETVEYSEANMKKAKSDKAMLNKLKKALNDERIAREKEYGQIKEIEEPFEVDNYTPMFPGDFGEASQDCNCRCILLQRARWALDEEELETLKQRAAFHGLDKTKDFEEYKKRYLKAAEIEKAPVNYGCKNVTKNWIDKANPKTGKIEEADKYITPKGIVYNVDGINVKQNNSKREIEVAELLHNVFGGDIYFIPKVNGKYNGVKSPDYVWNNERWDYKELKSSKDEAIRNAIHKKREQAENFIIDIFKNPLSDDKILEQAEKIFTYENTNFVKRLMILRGNEIIKIIERK